jgi:hypothetical protein
VTTSQAQRQLLGCESANRLRVLDPDPRPHAGDPTIAPAIRRESTDADSAIKPAWLDPFLAKKRRHTSTTDVRPDDRIGAGAATGQPLEA